MWTQQARRGEGLQMPCLPLDAPWQKLQIHWESQIPPSPGLIGEAPVILHAICMTPFILLQAWCCKGVAANSAKLSLLFMP